MSECACSYVCMYVSFVCVALMFPLTMLRSDGSISRLYLFQAINGILNIYCAFGETGYRYGCDLELISKGNSKENF